VAHEPESNTRGSGLKTGAVTPLPERVAVGRGTALFVDGRCSAPGARVESLSVRIEDRVLPVIASGMPMPGSTSASGPYWWAIVHFEPIEEPQTVTLQLDAMLAGGERANAGIGTLELVPDLSRPAAGPAPQPPGDAEGPLVAVAMATYEPSIELFRAQLDSIRAQGHRNWVCVISDDASGEEALTGMRAVIGDDPRVLLSSAERRSGVYGNFERALTLVPDAAEYVTLSDQDDAWRPDKLEKLLAAFRPGVRLTYSDMRIVDRDGNVSSDTYWQFRRNNYTNFASLVLANTVTGAASMFDRELLADALPFPPRQGNAYHDHWIAQVALALGEIAYVDEPLYDYVQHGGAALGHLSANAFGRYGRSLPTRVKMGLARVRQQGLSQGWRLYFDLYCRVRLAADVLEMRAGSRLAPAKRRALRRIADRPLGLAWLGGRSLRSLRGEDETLGRERAMLAGLIWRRVVVTRRRWGRLRGAERRLEAGASPAALAAPAAGGGGGSGPWLKPLLVDYFTRDGSTLMMRLLGSSPQIAVEGIYPYEQKYFAYLWRWAQTLDRVRWPEEQWGPRSLGSLGQFRDDALVGPPPWHPRTLIEPQGDEPTMSERAFELAWAEFSRRAARRTRERHGADAEVAYAAEKHLNTWLVDLNALPAVELVVLLRDPRDTWVSINSFNEMRGSATLGRERADNAAEHFEGIVSRQRDRLRWIARLLEEDRVPVVRYEELVLDLEGVATRLGERLGVEFDPSAVSRDRDMRTRHVSADSPEKSIGRWRTELDPETTGIFAERLGTELEAVGFEV
jgi:glycosyltransferase involved in cell wall biosynthesis